MSSLGFFGLASAGQLKAAWSEAESQARRVDHLEDKVRRKDAEIAELYQKVSDLHDDYLEMKEEAESYALRESNAIERLAMFRSSIASIIATQEGEKK